MLLVDAGTSYFKILDTKTNSYKVLSVIESKQINKNDVIYSTGHNKNVFTNSTKINELVALSKGVFSLINEDDYTIVDVGSRDIKLLEFKNKKFSKCNWNSTCGAMVGFTLELMHKYFDIKHEDLEIVETHIDITCGLLGITKFFDHISKDSSNIKSALSSLIFGMAKYTWLFSEKKEKIYLSGGLSTNELFIKYLNKLGSEVVPLGRYILLKGLKTYI